MKAKLLFLLCVLVFSSVQNEAAEPNKIVYFVSPPRSLSVAFTRMIQARGDFDIFHEPSIYAYDLIHYPEFGKATFKEESFATFNDVKQALYTAAMKKPVFAKEMSFAVSDFVIQDSEFITNDRVYFVFLVRNPHHSAISFYNRMHDVPDNLSHLIGLEPLYRLFKEVQMKAAHAPILIFSEELYTNPEQTVKRFCQQLNIQYLPHSLQWQNLGADFVGHEEWHEPMKSVKEVQHWHGAAIQSESFTKPSSYAVDESGEPTFCEIADSKMRQSYKEAWLYNQPYYELLAKF